MFSCCFAYNQLLPHFFFFVSHLNWTTKKYNNNSYKRTHNNNSELCVSVPKVSLNISFCTSKSCHLFRISKETNEIAKENERTKKWNIYLLPRVTMSLMRCIAFRYIQENGFWNILTKQSKKKIYLQQQQSHYTWLHYQDPPYALILISLGCCLLVYVSCVALSFNFIVICMLISNTVSSILSWNCAGFNGIISRSLLFRFFFSFSSFILQITMNCTFGHFTCKYFETLKMYVTLHIHMVKHTFYRMAKHTVYPFKLNVFIQQLKTNANIRKWNFAGTFKYVELKSM